MTPPPNPPRLRSVASPSTRVAASTSGVSVSMIRMCMAMLDFLTPPRTPPNPFQLPMPSPLLVPEVPGSHPVIAATMSRSAPLTLPLFFAVCFSV